MLDHVLVAAGYGGNSFEERLEKLTPTQVSNIKDLKEAHGLAERLLNEPGVEITLEGAEKAIKIYTPAKKKKKLHSASSIVYGGYGVMVNTAVCGTVNTGSIPVSRPT